MRLLFASTYRDLSLAVAVTVWQDSVCGSSPAPGGWERDEEEQRRRTFAWVLVLGLRLLRCSAWPQPWAPRELAARHVIKFLTAHH